MSFSLKKGNELPAVITLSSLPGWVNSLLPISWRCPAPCSLWGHKVGYAMPAMETLLCWSNTNVQLVCKTWEREKGSVSTKICVSCESVSQKIIYCACIEPYVLYGITLYIDICGMACDGVWWPAVKEWQWGYQGCVSLHGKRWKAKRVEPSLQYIAHVLQKALVNVTWIALLIFQQLIHQ